MKGIDVYNLLSDREKNEFKSNVDDDLFIRLINSDLDDRGDLISNAFKWKKTKEGYVYWHNIYVDMKNRKKHLVKYDVPIYKLFTHE